MQETRQDLSCGIPGQAPSKKQDFVGGMGMTPERQAEICEAWRKDLPEVLEGRDRMKSVIYNGIPLKGWTDYTPLKNYTVDHVLKCVTKITGVSLLNLKGPRRGAEFARPRQLAYLLLRTFCPSRSLPDIARAVGKLDHTTVIHGIKKARERVGKDPDYRALYNKIVRYIESRRSADDYFAEAMGDRTFD